MQFCFPMLFTMNATRFGYQWLGALALGHQWPGCWVRTDAFPAVYGLKVKKYLFIIYMARSIYKCGKINKVLIDNAFFPVSILNSNKVLVLNFLISTTFRGFWHLVKYTNCGLYWNTYRLTLCVLYKKSKEPFHRSVVPETLSSVPPHNKFRPWKSLTHWGRVTYICIGNLTIIGSDNGLSPRQRQAITWTNVGILLIRPLGTNFSEILIGIQTFSFKKMSSAKRRPFVSASIY